MKKMQILVSGLLMMKQKGSTLQRRNGREHQQRGLTLIELMVSLVIGLLLAIIASSTYLYSKQAYNVVSENAQLEENGRFALNLLTKQIQSAGFTTLDERAQFPNVPVDFKITGCSFGMVRPGAPTAASDFGCVNAAPAGAMPSASLAVFYDTDAFTTAGANFQGFDCMGNAAVTVVKPTALVSGTTSNEVRNYFFISDTVVQTPSGTTTMGQLSCVTDQNTGGSAVYTVVSQPLLSGIQQINFAYMTATGPDPQTPQARRDASLFLTPADWTRVIAVEVCVLAKSVQPSGNDVQSNYTDCFGNAFVAPASQTFRRMTTLVNLRNRTTG